MKNNATPQIATNMLAGVYNVLSSKVLTDAVRASTIPATTGNQYQAMPTSLNRRIQIAQYGIIIMA